MPFAAEPRHGSPSCRRLAYWVKLVLVGDFGFGHVGDVAMALVCSAFESNTRKDGCEGLH